MDIQFLGAGSVRLVARSLNLVVDPYTESSGLGKFNAKADVVLLTALEGFGTVSNALTIDGPGEYEVKGAMITGVPARLHLDGDHEGRRGTVYAVAVDELNIVITGNVAGKLDDGAIEALGKVDVLIVPVGGNGLTLDAQGAANVVAQLEPSYVVPVHYNDEKTTYPMPQDSLEAFLKEMGVTPEPESRLRVTPKDLPSETQVVALTRTGS